jgi:hypothetical protein
MRRITIILFFLGLLFESAAFMCDQAARIPLVLKLISPEYVRAQIGLKALAVQKELKTGDEGFSEISKVIISKLNEQNDPQKVAKIKIRKITKGHARLGFGDNGTREVIPITIFLSEVEAIDWSFAALENAIGELKNTSLFHYAIGIFVLGALIQLIAFYFEHKARHNATASKSVQIVQV